MPGLILEIFSDDGEYSYKIIGIDKNRNDIYIKNDNKIIKTNKKKYRDVESNFYENPGFYLGKSYDENMNESSARFPPIPFNRIEKED